MSRSNGGGGLPQDAFGQQMDDACANRILTGDATRKRGGEKRQSWGKRCLRGSAVLRTKRSEAVGVRVQVLPACFDAEDPAPPERVEECRGTIPNMDSMLSGSGRWQAEIEEVWRGSEWLLLCAADGFAQRPAQPAGTDTPS